MLYTQRIEKAIEATIASQYVLGEENTAPVNLLLSTLSGGGKSALLLKKYGLAKGVQAFGDITYIQLAEKYLDRAHLKKDRLWIFPEFNKIIGRKRSVANNTVGLIDEACEEGVPSISLPYFEMKWNPPAKVGVILGLTPSYLKAHAVDWWGIGFLQRFLRITWSYTDEQIEAIQSYIKKQMHLKESIWNQEFREREVEFPLVYADAIDLKFTRKICDDMTRYVAKLDPTFDMRLEKELPFRTQQRLQKLLKGIALRNKHSKVTKEDWKQFEEMFQHMNSQYLVVKE